MFVNGAGDAVTVLRTETGEAAALPRLPAPGEVLHLDAMSDDALRGRLDLVVAHVGGHFGFHGTVIPRLETLEMLGIFHDAFIANLAFGYMHAIGQQHASAALVEQTYPRQGMGEASPFGCRLRRWRGDDRCWNGSPGAARAPLRIPGTTRRAFAAPAPGR
ncbi:hypothetical protein ACFQX4_17210 [Roseomonas sp. GCM10028921]